MRYAAIAAPFCLYGNTVPLFGAVTIQKIGVTEKGAGIGGAGANRNNPENEGIR